MMYNPRPSTLYRDMVCPSWWKLPGGEEQSEWAEEGSSLHALVAECLKDGENVNRLLGIDEDDVEIINKCIEFAELKRPTGKDVAQFVEHPVSIQFPEWVMRGTLDLKMVGHYVKETAIIDWKMGYQPLHKDRVYCQLGSYAIDSLLGGDEVVDSWAHMPRIGKTYHHQFRQEDIPKIMGAIDSTREKCNAPGMTLQIEPAACEHCPKKAICPLHEHERGLIVDTPSVELMTTQQIQKVLALAPAVAKIAKAVKAHLKTLDELPKGIGSKDIAGNREFTNLFEIWELLVEREQLMTSRQFIKLCKLSFGTVVDEIKEGMKERIGKKTGHKKAAEELLSPYVERGEGKKQFFVTEE